MTVAQPFFLPAAALAAPLGTTGVALNTAGTLVTFSGAGGAISSIPVATAAAAASAATIPAGLVYGALAAKKVIAAKLILDAIANRDADARNHHH